MYKWVLLLHVIGGATWFGAHVYLEGLMASAFRSKDPSITMSVMTKMADTNRRVMPVAAILTIVFGIWTVFESGYEFETLFVSLGFVLAIAGLAIGVFVLTPRERTLQELVDEHGLGSHEAITSAKSLANLSHAQTAIVAIALIVMVLKPG